jgi:bacteriocin-like protein
VSKTNDPAKTRELTEAELAAVSGGYTFSDCMISSFVATGGGTGSGTAGWDVTKNKAC